MSALHVERTRLKITLAQSYFKIHYLILNYFKLIQNDSKSIAINKIHL